MQGPYGYISAYELNGLPCLNKVLRYLLKGSPEVPVRKFTPVVVL